jgi:Fe-S-cluster-containing hydrogenase component 2
VATCPQGAIVQDDIFSAPRIDHEKCTECGLCETACRVFQNVPDDDRVPVGAATTGVGV